MPRAVALKINVMGGTLLGLPAGANQNAQSLRANNRNQPPKGHKNLLATITPGQLVKTASYDELTCNFY